MHAFMSLFGIKASPSAAPAASSTAMPHSATQNGTPSVQPRPHSNAVSSSASKGKSAPSQSLNKTPTDDFDFTALMQKHIRPLDVKYMTEMVNGTNAKLQAASTEAQELRERLGKRKSFEKKNYYSDDAVVKRATKKDEAYSSKSLATLKTELGDDEALLTGMQKDNTQLVESQTLAFQQRERELVSDYAQLCRLLIQWTSATEKEARQEFQKARVKAQANLEAATGAFEKSSAEIRARLSHTPAALEKELGAERVKYDDACKEVRRREFQKFAEGFGAFFTLCPDMDAIAAESVAHNYVGTEAVALPVSDYRALVSGGCSNLLANINRTHDSQLMGAAKSFNERLNQYHVDLDAFIKVDSESKDALVKKIKKIEGNAELEEAQTKLKAKTTAVLQAYKDEADALERESVDFYRELSEAKSAADGMPDNKESRARKKILANYTAMSHAEKHFRRSVQKALQSDDLEDSISAIRAYAKYGRAAQKAENDLAEGLLEQAQIMGEYKQGHDRFGVYRPEADQFLEYTNRLLTKGSPANNGRGSIQRLVCDAKAAVKNAEKSIEKLKSTTTSKNLVKLLEKSILDRLLLWNKQVSKLWGSTASIDVEKTNEKTGKKETVSVPVPKGVRRMYDALKNSSLTAEQKIEEVKKIAIQRQSEKVWIGRQPLTIALYTSYSQMDLTRLEDTFAGLETAFRKSSDIYNGRDGLHKIDVSKPDYEWVEGRDQVDGLSYVPPSIARVGNGSGADVSDEKHASVCDDGHSLSRPSIARANSVSHGSAASGYARQAGLFKDGSSTPRDAESSEVEQEVERSQSRPRGRRLTLAQAGDD
jgi:hypothetical protein